MPKKLRVLAAMGKDKEEGIGRIDEDLMKKLNIHQGNPITLIGKRKTSTIAWPSYKEDRGKGVIRLNSFTRENAGVKLGEHVEVMRAEYQEARLVVLAPIDMRLNVDRDFINFVKTRLIERRPALTEGDTTRVIMLGHLIPFKIFRARPQAACLLITENTKLKILNEPIDRAKHPEATVDIKKLLRHDWLKVVSSRIGAKHITYSILGTDKEAETETEILDHAKNVVEEKWEPARIVVNFYSDRGDLIGSLPWLQMDPLRNSEAIYPDVQLPPDPGYLRRTNADIGTSTSMMRRCFKTGINKCPKKINFSPKTVFVAMPFRPEYQDIYKYAIRPALEEMGLEIWKADEKISNIDIMCKICQGIQECSYVVTNISDWNPNVLFEMGLAYGVGKYVILIKNRKEEVPVDLKGLEYIDYETIDELKRNLITFFKSLEKYPKDK